MTAVVKDARPPTAVVRVLNPVLCSLLRSPVGRLIGPLALIEFTGRRSNKTYRVVVAWHDLLDTPIVLTPAPWRANFTTGASVTVRWRGRRANYFAVLDTDPDNVATAMNTMLANGTSARGLALHIPTGHHVNRDDVIATRRALIRFQPTNRAGHEANPPTTGDRPEIQCHGT